MDGYRWYGFKPEIPTNLDGRSRRALYRPSDGLRQSSIADFPQSIRRQHHAYQDHVTYAFEFYADYFDPTTFVLRPTFTNRKDIR